MNMRINPKTIDLMSGHFAATFTHGQIVDFLVGCGVPRENVVMEGSKPYRFRGTLTKYLTDKKEDFDVLSRVIFNYLHPLNFAGDEARSREMIGVFNGWLKYDDLEVEMIAGYLGWKHKYSKLAEDEMISEVEQDTDISISLVKKRRLDDLILLKKSYQLLRMVVDLFFENPQVLDDKLNDVYLRLCKISESSVKKVFDFEDDENGPMLSVSLPGREFYKPPFTNLFSAANKLDQLESRQIIEESTEGFRITTPEQYTTEIKKKMKGYYGELSELCFQCEAGEELNQVGMQKLIEDITNYVSALKKEGIQIRPIVAINVLPWPDDYKWSDDGKTFLISNKGKLDFFGNEDAIRRILFKMLTDGRGEWVNVKDMADKTNKEENYVRVVVGQISDRLKNKKYDPYISIEPKDKIEEPGAYRLIVKL